MTELEASDSFRLGRLRLIRLPPSSISLPASGLKKPQTAQIELAVGVTDDYGTDLMFDSVDLRIDALDSRTLRPPSGLTVRLANSSSSASSSDSNGAIFSFSPSNGPFHTLKLSLNCQPAFTARSVLPSLTFRLSVASSSSPTPKGSDATRCVRTLIGEPDQAVIETWDEKRYVLMSVRSGIVEIQLEGKEVKVAREKVQTALRTIHLPSRSLPSPDLPLSSPSSTTALPPTSQSRTISSNERPGLNNSTGQRLWDCAIGMSAFLSLFPHALDAAASLPSIDIQSDEPRSKKRRVDQANGGRRRRIRVVELGAGCALASMAASRILSSAQVAGETSVRATDVEATVETTLKENLEANSAGKAVEAAVLDWGELSQETVDSVVGGRARRPGTDATRDDETSLTLVATDVLYNPSSHSLLLSTLLSLLRSHSSPTTLSASRRALIAYKRRTEGDDGFFALAKDAGLEVTKVWEWGEVSVWSLV